MGMLRHWLQGRKIDHIVLDSDARKTICGLTTKPVNDIRFLPFISFDKGINTYCKKCTKIYMNRRLYND